MNQIAKNQQATAPSVSGAGALAELSKALSLPSYAEKLNALIVPEGAEYRAGTPITEQIRQDLTRRADLIDERMAAMPLGVSTSTILIFLNFFPLSSRQDETSLKLKCAGYQMAVSALPTWAIDKAITAYSDGSLGVHDFAPSPPALAITVKDVVMAAKGRASHMRRLATLPVAAEPLSQEKRSAIAAKVAELMKPKPMSGDAA